MSRPPAFGPWPAPWWLPGGNLQTIVPALWGRRTAGALPRWHRERWDTPDGDFVDADWMIEPPEVHRQRRPLLVLFHGLEGSSASHYAQAFADVARESGLAFVVPHFRGCSGEINRAPRAYHSGDHAEIDWMLRRLQARHDGGELYAVGVSLGGHALLRWAAEQGEAAGPVVRAIAAVSAPIDLGAAGQAIDQGFNRLVYARMFLRTMVRKAEQKWQQFPGLFDIERIRRARTLFEFDDVFTGPLHGFAGTRDYWQRASAKPHLHRIRVPTLALNARNDPFVPGESLPHARDATPAPYGAADAAGPQGLMDYSHPVRLWQPTCGGHVGFARADKLPGRIEVRSLPRCVLDWLLQPQ